MAEGQGPLVVTAELIRADQAWAESLRRAHYPPERNHVPAHLTLFHHLPPSIEDELRTVLKALSLNARPAARIEGLRSLGTGVAIALSCPLLIDMWEEIAATFKRFLIPQDSHPPKLHITIQNKVDRRTAAETLAKLEASVARRETAIGALVCWRYRDGPWQPIARYAFRG